MARVTVEDCVRLIPNRFLLVQAAIRRTRNLMEGSKPLVNAKNREAVLALREIAAEKVRPVLGPAPPKLEAEPAAAAAAEEDAMLDAAIEEVSLDQAEGVEAGEGEAAEPVAPEDVGEAESATEEHEES